MSDYGYDSDDYDLYDDDGWLYIAEEDHLADDLAERAIASPPPRDYDLDGSGYNSDYYEYWVDIEYNSDGWNDVNRASNEQKKDESEVKQSGPKKRKRATQGGPAQKKRKGAHTARAGGQDVPSLPTVLWQSRESRMVQLLEGPRALKEEPESFALLKDWRTRFGDVPPPAKGKGPSIENASHSEAHAGTESSANADEEAVSPKAGEDDLENLISSSGLDPEALMRALRENLAATGAAPTGLDQATLLKYALRMLSGESEADDIAGELADEMFEQVEDDDAEAEETASGVSTLKGAPINGDSQKAAAGEGRAPPEPDQASLTKLPPTPPPTRTNTDAAPVPAVKGKEPKGKEPKGKQPVSTSVAAGSRKRKAADPDPDDAPPPTKPRRSTRSYEAATANSTARSASGKGGKSKRG